MPWLNLRACEALNVYPPASVVVVDDTPIGIQAARNAGMWAVGITMTGNGLGLSQADAESLPSDELERRLGQLDAEYLAAGAHFVLKQATGLIPVLDEVNRRMANGIQPL